MKKLLLILPFIVSCQEKVEVENPKFEWRSLEVTASAYNSLSWQTKAENPNIAAWGDTLKPGMKSIAVSRDLIKMGLGHNTMVKIGTWPDTFYVKDKMNRRWRNRIDIYMGVDVKKAREWGKQKIDICFAIPLDTTSTLNR
ncbi:3D domain-containing protein [Flagellimonas meridianipacifica]|uniref:3D domain-containing protein n=1 Tax=Flagellimonas meridianipacifica TaxID=1080225 RepID=UPI001FE74815|nr:3D domain-containing protein [Allomuricauda pacifica]